MVIKQLRKELGITQKEFAEKLNITQGRISAIERNDNITLKFLKKVAETFDKDLIILFQPK